jgi:transglycosylase-like protein
MKKLHEQRIRPGHVISLVSMMILGGSMARAEIAQLSARSAHVDRFSPSLSSSLALLPRQVTRETWTLRVDLAREQRQDHLATVERKGWAKDHTVSSAKVPPAASVPALASAPAPAIRSFSADWYAIVACESGGVWNINTGNGYWGGLQFSPSTWFAYGGGPFNGSGPFPYSTGQQIAVGERVLAAQGPGAWPNCFRWA